MANAINWFEIPAKDLNRACSFYSSVLGGDIHREEILGLKMGFLPHGKQEVGGALVEGDGYEPSQTGPLVYLNGGADLSGPLGKVEDAGGTIVLPKTKVSDEIGYIAIINDTEGNKIAFHSPQ